MIPIQKIDAVQARKLRRPQTEDMTLYRIQLAITVASVDDAGTDSTVFVQLNENETPFYLVKGIDNFEKGSRVVYDVLPQHVKKLSDLHFVKFGVRGNDGVCLKKVELFLNGHAIAVFSKDLGPNGIFIDNDDARNVKNIVLTGAEMRNSASWKAAVAASDIWLPIKTISREMIVSLVEASIGNQMQSSTEPLAWGNKTGIDTIWGDAVEATFVNANTIHIDLDCQREIAGPNPELDVDFDMHFTCVNGIIKVNVDNLKTRTNLVGDIQTFFRGKIAELVGLAIKQIPVVGGVAAPVVQGRLAAFLAFSLNVSIEAPNVSQSCALIRVTPDCDIILH